MAGQPQNDRSLPRNTWSGKKKCNDHPSSALLLLHLCLWHWILYLHGPLRQSRRLSHFGCTSTIILCSLSAVATTVGGMVWDSWGHNKRSHSTCKARQAGNCVAGRGQEWVVTCSSVASALFRGDCWPGDQLVECSFCVVAATRRRDSRSRAA